MTALSVRFRACACLQLVAEGIPAAGHKLPRVASLFQHQQLSLSGDSSNRGEIHTTKSLRQELCFAWRHGEQQFVVIPAMQRKLYGIAAVLESRLRGSHLRDLCPFQERTDRACSAHPWQIA